MRIIPIGSAAAVVRHLAGRYKEDKTYSICAFLDGDKRLNKHETVNLFVKTLEKNVDENEATQWIENRLSFLPGDTWPEKWIIQKHNSESFDKLPEEFGLPKNDFAEIIESAKQADKHDELFELSKKLSLPLATIKSRFIRCALEGGACDVEKISKFVGSFL